MQTGSKKIFFTADELQEEIYKDEIEDGIANCAEEQAATWAEAVHEEENSESKKFVEELLKMTKQIKQEKNGKMRAGGLGCKTRLQPRFQKGNQQKFDRVVEARIKNDFKAMQITKEQAKKVKENMRNLILKEDNLENYDKVPFLSDKENEFCKNWDCEQVVIKIGNQFIKAGFGGDDAPRAVFPTIVGRPRHSGVMVGMGQKDSYVGDEAQSKRGILTLKFPIENGKITNFDDYERLLHHTFYNELRIDPNEHRVVLLEHPGIAQCMREKICQILFETFNIPCISFLSSPISSILASGRSTGISVHIGKSNIWIVPVFEGFVLPYASTCLQFGSSDITNYLMKIITERGYSFTTTAERDILADVKEKLCYVASDFEEEMHKSCSSSSIDASYELPDGQVITIGNERFRAVEPFFQPSFIGSEEPGLVELICNSILACDPSLHSRMIKNIILSGGGSLIAGLSKRIQQELENLLPSSVQVKIIDPPERRYSDWIGASISTTFTYTDGITKEEYDKNGPSVISKHFHHNGYWENLPRLKINKFNNTNDNIDNSVLIPPPLPILNDKIDKITSNDDKLTSNDTKSKEIVCKQPEANSNSMLIHVGKICEETSNIYDDRCHKSYPFICESCSAVFNEKSTLNQTNMIWKCEFCHHENESNEKTPLVSSIYLTEECYIPNGENDADICAVPSSMVIFCMDTSGSMSSSVSRGISRLACIKKAFKNQIDYLKLNQPDTIVVLITFGSSVNVYYPENNFKSISIPSSNASFEKGKEIAGEFIKTIEETHVGLLKATNSLQAGGCTALGPCLNLAVGISSSVPQSSILLFTDGLANAGVGNLQTNSGKKFYPELANKAVKQGTRIDVITMEGEESGLAHLGVLADTTSGTVDVVDPFHFEKAVKECMSSKSIATDVSCLTILPKSLLQFKSPYENGHILQKNFGSTNVDLIVSNAFDWTNDAKENLQSFYNPTSKLIDHSDYNSLKIQNQISYTDKYGNRKLFVETLEFDIDGSTERVEKSLNTSVIAMESIHRAASFAQLKMYDAARILLVSTQRLLQRNMKVDGCQKDYLSFIVQAEKLDGFMREAKLQEEILATKSGDPDDDASKSIFQMKSLSLKTFQQLQV